jgi:hypothetical protein
VTSPRTTVLSCGTAASGSNPPERSSSYSRDHGANLREAHSHAAVCAVNAGHERLRMRSGWRCLRSSWSG